MDDYLEQIDRDMAEYYRDQDNTMFGSEDLDNLAFLDLMDGGDDGFLEMAVAAKMFEQNNYQTFKIEQDLLMRIVLIATGVVFTTLPIVFVVYKLFSFIASLVS